MQETRVRSLSWEDPLEQEMATHSTVVAWKIPGTEELVRSPWGCKEFRRVLFRSGGSVAKNLPANEGDMGSIPELGRSPGEENESHSSILEIGRASCRERV